MLNEAFKQLSAYTEELIERSEGTNPVPFDKMVEIYLMITSCEKIAITNEEKSILNEVRDVWNACLKKWFKAIEEPEEYKKLSKKDTREDLRKPPTKNRFEEDRKPLRKSKKAWRPRPFNKVRVLISLKDAISTLKSRRGLFKMTYSDFDAVMNLIEQVESIANTGHERKIVSDAKDTYLTRFKEWQEYQKKKNP